VKVVFTILLILLFVPVYCYALFGFDTQATILNRDFYKSHLKKADFYNRFLVELPKFGPEGKQDQGSKRLSELITANVSSDYLQKTTELAINGFFDWLAGKQSLLDVTFDTTPVKRSFTKFAEEFTEKEWGVRLDQLPTCTRQDWESLPPVTEGEEQPMPRCRPTTDDFFEVVKHPDGKVKISPLVLAAVPEKLKIADFMTEEKGEEANRGFDQNRTTLTFFGFSIWAAVVAALLLLGLVFLLYRKSLKSAFRMTGFVLLIATALALIGVIPGLIMAEALPRVVAGGLSNFPKSTQDLIYTLLNSMMGDMVGYWMRWAVIFFVLGLLLVIIPTILGLIFKRRPPAVIPAP